MNRNCLLLSLLSISAYLISGTVGDETILGGKLTKIDDFRYLVSLLQVNYGHLCGGAIIGEYFVLSAAHCFMYRDNTFKSKQVFALMGTSDLMKMTYPSFNSEVVKVYIPTEFNASNILTSGDIAVLRVRDPLQLAYYRDLKAVRLERTKNLDHSAEKAVIAGWGWNIIHLKGNQEIGLRSDSLLRYAEVDVLNHEQCHQQHPQLGISEKHLCARVKPQQHEARGVCHGDDGDPLVANGFVIGILSIFPKGCEETRMSAIYTRVSHYLTFIRNALNDHVTRNMRVHVLQF